MPVMNDSSMASVFWKGINNDNGLADTQTDRQ